MAILAMTADFATALPYQIIKLGAFHFGGGLCALTPPGDKSARLKNYVR
jgi:hypothetical protein